MAFIAAASTAPYKACAILPEAASSQCRAAPRQQASRLHRNYIGIRALSLGRLPAPPLVSQHVSKLLCASSHGQQHALGTLAAPCSGPSEETPQNFGWTAVPLALLPMLLRAMQPNPASAEEALSTNVEQAASGIDIGGGSGEKVLSSAAEAAATGGIFGMSTTDSITAVLFYLAVAALVVLTLGVAYLTIASFFDDRRQIEDLAKLDAADLSRAAAAAKPGLKKRSKNRPAPVSRGGGKGFGGKEKEF